MKNKIFIFTVMAVLLLSIAAVQAHIPGAPDSLTDVRSVGSVNFTWAVNATESNITNGYNATIDSGATWSNGTNTYYYLTGKDSGDVITVEVWAWNSTGSGNLSIYNSSDSATIFGSGVSRGAPALAPSAILGGLALWSAIIVLASRRKKREN